MIKQITEKSIGHRIRFHIFYSPIRSLFFKIDLMTRDISSLADYLDEYKRRKKYPIGIYGLDTIIENEIFEITFSEHEITEEGVIEFAKSLGL